MTDSERINQLEKDRDEVVKKLTSTSKLLNDLIEYMERNEIILGPVPGSWESWHSELERARQFERKQKELEDARRLLENEGYVVAKEQSELDLRRLQKWMEGGSSND